MVYLIGILIFLPLTLPLCIYWIRGEILPSTLSAFYWLVICLLWPMALIVLFMTCFILCSSFICNLVGNLIQNFPRVHPKNIDRKWYDLDDFKGLVKKLFK